MQHQKQQIDDKKSTNANYNRKSQANLNLAYYNNSATTTTTTIPSTTPTNRNMLSDNNYYVTRDYQSSPENQCISTPTSLASISLSSHGPLPSDVANATNSINDQISALFPKCRPKNDANWNKATAFNDVNNMQLTSAANLLDSSPSSGDYKNQNKNYCENECTDHTLINDNRAYARTITTATKNYNDAAVIDKVERSRNAAICQTANATKLNFNNYSARNSNIIYQRTPTNQQQQQQQQPRLKNDCHKLIGPESLTHLSKKPLKWETLSSDNNQKTVDILEIERENNFWEKRHKSPNTTPASTVLNSPDFNETHHYHHHPVQHQIKVGRSPVNQHEYNNKDGNNVTLDSPIQMNYQRHAIKQSTDSASDEDAITFDNIDNWRMKNERNVSVQATHTIENHNRFNHSLLDKEFDDESENSAFNTDKVTKIIGILPIAEYEGSPRRIGSYNHELPLHQYAPNANQTLNERTQTAKKMLSSPTLFPPRPGFPKVKTHCKFFIIFFFF